MSIYGKRNKYREVPLNSTAREALTSYVRTLPDGAGYLFPSRKRGDSSAGVGPVGERALIYIVSKYADQARVRDLSPHDLRHRYASLKLAEGVPVTDLAAQLGHAKKSLTLDTYSHVLLAGHAARQRTRRFLDA